MSYCVHCGVELAPSEKECPLCGAAVIDTIKPWEEPKHYPYPKTLQRTYDSIDKRYSAIYASLFLAVPVAVSIITDICISGNITWSWYVLGAGLCIFCFFLMPILLKKRHIYLNVALDFAAVLIYLALIARLTSFSWYLPLAAPITVITASVFMASIYISKHAKPFSAAAAILVLTGIACVAIEILIDNFAFGYIKLFWSLIVTTSVFITALALLFIQKKQRLKEEIKKRLFM